MKKIIASLLLAVSLPSYAFFYDGNQLSAWNNARKKALNNNAETVDYLDAGVYRGLAEKLAKERKQWTPDKKAA